jgi:alkylation response protein AidB-like acyl-CoA dehydrogenase
MSFGVVQEHDWNAMDDARFRGIMRAEFEEHYPAAIRYPSRRLYWTEQRDWFLRMARKGWIAPNWPAEFGGMGLDPAKLLIFFEEQERWGIARYQDQGVRMIGPMLFEHGTPEQRERFLPGILSCADRYCQGYSEPEAGSDLASLRTRARRDGDDYVVDGHKIWTTMAHDVTHIMILARTDPDAPKHQGISFFLTSLDTPGITVRPIRDVAGHDELCEVFLEGVRIPADQRVGAENAGWLVANSVLSFERVHIGAPTMPAYALERLRLLAERRGLAGSPAFRERFAELELDLRHLGDLYEEFASVVLGGGTPGADVSILKIWATELTRRIGDLICDTAGPAGAVRQPLDLDGERFEILDVFYKALPSTIYGGTNDIQRNVVAKRVLGLPAEPGRAAS